MSKHRFKRPDDSGTASAGQRGMALVVVMVLLIAISGIAVWTVRRTELGEAVARSQVDQQAARQAAETALRDAERDLMNTSVASLPNASCSRAREQILPTDFTSACDQGLCQKTDAAYAVVDWTAATSTNKTVAEPWWPTGKGGLWNDDESTKPNRTSSPVGTSNSTFTGGVPLGTYTGAKAIYGVAKQPEYLIEVFRRKNVRMNMDESQVANPANTSGTWGSMYRITARGFGYTERTQVVLQSIYFP